MNKWEKETAQAHLKSEADTLEELKKVYQKAQKDVQERLRRLNARQDMQNLQSIIYQKKYQQILLKQISGVIDELEKNSNTTSNDFFRGSYEDGYVGSMYELHREGIPITVPVSKEKMMTAIKTDSKLSKGYYLKQGLSVSNFNTLKKNVTKEVSRGIATGSDWLSVAESLALQKKFTIALSDSMRIVRTEGNRINQQARLDAGDEAVSAGCDLLKQWDATLDSKTRPAHREADGQIVEWDEDFTVMGEKLKAPSIGGSASNVCNCRCQLLKRPRWALDQEELEELKKRAEYYGLDKSKNFEDFKEKFLKLPEVKPADDSFKDQMNTIRDRVKQQGRATDADIHEAGRLLKDRLKKNSPDLEKPREEYRNLLDKKGDMDEKISLLSAEIDKLIGSTDDDDFLYKLLMGENQNSDKIDEIQKQIDDILNGKEYQDIVSRMEELNKILHMSVFDHAKILKDTLSEFREMGHPDLDKGVKKSKSPVRDILRDALGYYPTDWIQYAIDSGGIKTKSVSRGYCDTWDNLIAISGYDKEEAFETGIHELGHYFERKVSINNDYIPWDNKMWWKRYINDYYPEGQTYILDAEREFYARRTADEDLEWLGRGYSRKERTRKDQFINPYMGKDYEGHDFELVSMGFEYAYTDPETLAKDPDMEAWIYGILSLY